MAKRDDDTRYIIQIISLGSEENFRSWKVLIFYEMTVTGILKQKLGTIVHEVTHTLHPSEPEKSWLLISREMALQDNGGK